MRIVLKVLFSIVSAILLGFFIWNFVQLVRVGGLANELNISLGANYAVAMTIYITYMLAIVLLNILLWSIRNAKPDQKYINEQVTQLELEQKKLLFALKQHADIIQGLQRELSMSRNNGLVGQQGLSYPQNNKFGYSQPLPPQNQFGYSQPLPPQYAQSYPQYPASTPPAQQGYSKQGQYTPKR